MIAQQHLGAGAGAVPGQQGEMEISMMALPSLAHAAGVAYQRLVRQEGVVGGLQPGASFRRIGGNGGAQGEWFELRALRVDGVQLIGRERRHAKAALGRQQRQAFARQANAACS